MSVSIRNIYIENFRSIEKINLPTKNLSVFVGKNDSGKSNILRALNLFFNEVTNPRQNLNFDSDYNLFVPARAKTAREIIVRLEFDIPASYQSTNGQIIVWEKRWRAGGLHYDEYWGERLSSNRVKREVRTRVDIPDKSNAHALLRQVDFEYIPAIKDATYFDDLRGRIYAIIAEVAARTFRTSSTAFEDSIGEHLADLTVGIGSSLGFQTRLALPRDLSHIFQRLDFLSGEKRISLENRGDGIKARHIPLILKFMAEKKRSLQGRGSAPHSFIWAYEEPENNLEFMSAVELASQLSTFAQSAVSQILLTTHSPVFYDLGEDGSTHVTRAHIFRDTDEKGTSGSLLGSDVDAKMGTMSLLAPRVKQLVHDVREQVEAKHVAAALASQNRPKIFVEGASDKVFLLKMAQIFYPSKAAEVDFETKAAGGGHSYVVDMLNGWRSQHKHHTNGPKAAGLLDCDAAHVKRLWNDGDGNVQSAKCFCYPKPDHAIAALDQGFALPVTLEVLYAQQVWIWAETNGFLKDRERREIFPKDLIERALRGEAGDYQVDETYKIYVTRQFETGTKVRTAQYVSELPEEQLREQYSKLGVLLGDVFKYLGLNDET